MATPGALKQLNWASATPPVVELIFASFLANDLPEAILANQKTAKLGEIQALLEQDDRFGEHGVKPPSLSTLATWFNNGEKAWKAGDDPELRERAVANPNVGRAAINSFFNHPASFKREKKKSTKLKEDQARVAADIRAAAMDTNSNRGAQHGEAEEGGESSESLGSLSLAEEPHAPAASPDATEQAAKRHKQSGSAHRARTPPPPGAAGNEYESSMRTGAPARVEVSVLLDEEREADLGFLPEATRRRGHHSHRPERATHPCALRLGSCAHRARHRARHHREIRTTKAESVFLKINIL